MRGMLKTIKRLGWSGSALLVFLAAGASLRSQEAPSPDVTNGPATPTLLRTEGTDAGTGIHWVRLRLSLLSAGDADRAPRFIMECQDLKGKHSLLWFLNFGGFDDPGFIAPFQAKQNDVFGPQYPGVDLKMTFEGYTKMKPFTRSWAVMPNGEYRFRNAGADSPNMDSARHFLPFLNSLPGLRIVHAKPAKGDPGDLFFPTRPLLDELNKTPICAP
jgi:hypothetical protein